MARDSEEKDRFREADVLTWLQANPDFLRRHLKELSPLLPPGGKVLSLEVGQLERFRAENEELRNQLDGMLHRIRRNESIYQAFHLIQGSFLRAMDMESLLLTAFHNLERVFDICRVALTLSEHAVTSLGLFPENTPPPGLADRLFVLPDERLRAVMGTEGRSIIRVGREGAAERHLFFGEAGGLIRSEALIPLLEPLASSHETGNTTTVGRLLGSLNLGGATPSRFLPSDATDLVQNLADMLCLNLIHRVSPRP
ncbi:MAG: DUF484 family protein [Magnetococcales bacterium]|nr:DUF484 family protein [Magnetococcales bacterium]MBF0157148.1 DUF484 family protein [Magnetococcales bacterium]